MGKKFTEKEFMEKAKQIHGDKYDYRDVIYKGYYSKVEIMCPKHGKFTQGVNTHLSGCGCQKCAKENLIGRISPKRKTAEQFINEARKIHGEKYDYSKVNYKNSHEKMCIICPEHGEFWQTPNKHICGKQGCPKCGHDSTNKSQCRDANSVLDELKSIFGDRYDYSTFNYIKQKEFVTLVCKKHGVFSARVDHLLDGHGCPRCQGSHLEIIIDSMLRNNSLQYIYQYRNKEILGRQSLDFYLPDYKIAIECQGIQHVTIMQHKKLKYKTTEDEVKYIQELDKKKKEICVKNGIEIIYFIDKSASDYFKDYLGKVFYDKDELLQYILSKKMRYEVCK